MSTIKRILEERMGFITDKDLPFIVAENRLHRCLVRCGNGRFTCPAQDVEHFVKIIGNSEDYVRDVSLLKK